MIAANALPLQWKMLHGGAVSVNNLYTKDEYIPLFTKRSIYLAANVVT